MTEKVKSHNLLFLLLIACFCNLSFVFAEDPPELKKYLSKSAAWHFDSLDRDVPFNVYYISSSTHSRPWNIGSPVIVYVKNHGYERIGQEPDLPILMDYIKQHYIVITMDFENNKNAVSPNFDKDMHNFFQGIYANKSESIFAPRNMTPRKYRTFFLPAGCRVATDLVYWELDKHGANGTLEYIMGMFNRDIAGVVTGKTKVTSPEQMTDRQNRPFQYKLAMDIVYPSQPKRKVPLIVTAATQVTRHPQMTPKTYRPHRIGFLMRGYACAFVDHCYNPIRRHFWFDSSKYSLDRWNGLASSTAAIRYLRANAEKYGIDDRYIGAMGHSKGEYMVARLTDPENAKGQEAAKFEGFKEGSPEPQPWQRYSSQITVGYQSPGSWAQYVTANDVPTIVSHGGKDSFAKSYYKEAFDTMEKLDTNHLSLLMKEIGHELPYGYDEELGVDRYALVHTFFDRYLRVEDKLPPAVLYILPCDGKKDVSPSDSVAVHFAPVMDLNSVINSVKVVSLKDSSAVKGAWEAARKGTYFSFVPENKFKNGENYKVIVTDNVADERGTKLDKSKTIEFTILKD